MLPRFVKVSAPAFKMVLLSQLGRFSTSASPPLLNSEMPAPAKSPTVLPTRLLPADTAPVGAPVGLTKVSEPLPTAFVLSRTKLS